MTLEDKKLVTTQEIGRSDVDDKLLDGIFSLKPASTPAEIRQLPITRSVVVPLLVEGPVYFGRTLTGQKDHAGMYLSGAVLRNTREPFIRTFCGSEMIAEDVSTQLDLDRSRHFCRICYNALYENVFNRLWELKQSKQLASDRLMGLLGQAKSTRLGWSGKHWQEEVEKLAIEQAQLEDEIFTFAAKLTPDQFRDAYAARHGLPKPKRIRNSRSRTI